MRRNPADTHGVIRLIRLTRSPAMLMYRLAARTTARLHGSCLGAGIELPAFAAQVLAAEDTTMGLPELTLGLIPGAGGTASLPRRIGRWRTAYLGLTGQTIDADQALRWGLVDAITLSALQPSDRLCRHGATSARPERAMRARRSSATVNDWLCLFRQAHPVGHENATPSAANVTAPPITVMRTCLADGSRSASAKGRSSRTRSAAAPGRTRRAWAPGRSGGDRNPSKATRATTRSAGPTFLPDGAARVVAAAIVAHGSRSPYGASLEHPTSTPARSNEA